MWQNLYQKKALENGSSSSFVPADFSGDILLHLGAVLEEYGFHLESRSKWQCRFRSRLQKLEFYWDRQEIIASLEFKRYWHYPRDRTLKGTKFSGYEECSVDLGSAFRFLGTLSPQHRFFVLLNNPDDYHVDLVSCAKWVPSLEEFFKKRSKIYSAFRRYEVTKQLKYDWEMREAYADAEKVTEQIVFHCRLFAKRWEKAGDRKSASEVLSIIEAELSEQERKWLSDLHSSQK